MGPYVDFIFGNAAVVFQECNIFSRLPMPHQFTVITAQSRDAPYENTGISMQNCSILPATDLQNSSAGVQSFLGRPWKTYSRTVFMKSYIADHIAPEGWKPWTWDSNISSLSNLYYGEYDNNGPGSATDNRIAWPGYHKMDEHDASNFTVSEFISGDEWLDSTFFPYDDGV